MCSATGAGASSLVAVVFCVWTLCLLMCVNVVWSWCSVMCVWSVWCGVVCGVWCGVWCGVVWCGGGRRRRGVEEEGRGKETEQGQQKQP